MRTTGHAFAALVVLLAAPASAQRPTIRDSAGVRIVEHETIRGAPVAFRFAPTPFYDVGGMNDDPRLELLARTPWDEAVRLSDGSVVTAEANELRVFGPDGKYVRTIGRKGQGPGEFPNQIGGLCRLRGDSILVIQYGGVRASVFTRDGVYVRMTPLTQYVPRFACTEDGRVLVQAAPTDIAAYRGGLYMNETHTFLDTKTSQAQSPAIAPFRVATFSGMEQRNTTIAIHADRIYVANGETYEVRVHSFDGALVQIVRVREAPATFSDADARAATTGRPIARGAQFRPPTHYAYRDVRIDALGRIWVQDHLHGGTPGWTVFAAGGEMLGRVELPVDGRLELIRVGADYALFSARLEQDLGAVRFRMYRFTRP